MTTVLALVVRIVLILLVLRFLLRFVAGVVRGYRGDGGTAAAPATGSTAAVELVRDEVCNTFVPRQKALVAEVGGRTAHFCSPACRDRALAARR